MQHVASGRRRRPNDGWLAAPRLGSGGGKTTSHNAALRDLIIAGRATPSLLVSHELPLDQAPDAYDKFDMRADGYTKVLLHP
jgi:glutathione-independent formaldehyde dehydrogenase